MNKKELDKKIEQILSSPSLDKVWEALEKGNFSKKEKELFRGGVKAGIIILNDLKKVSISISRGEAPPLILNF